MARNALLAALTRSATRPDQPVHYMIGVGGSGKSWTGDQVGHDYTYVRHDQYPAREYGQAIIRAARSSDKPILCEAPFRTQALLDELRGAGLHVTTYYFDEPLTKVQGQFAAREGRTPPKGHASNHARYAARDYDHRGSSEQMRDLLRR